MSFEDQFIILARLFVSGAFAAIGLAILRAAQSDDPEQHGFSRVVGMIIGIFFVMPAVYWIIRTLLWSVGVQL